MADVGAKPLIALTIVRIAQLVVYCSILYFVIEYRLSNEFREDAKGKPPDENYRTLIITLLLLMTLPWAARGVKLTDYEPACITFYVIVSFFIISVSTSIAFLVKNSLKSGRRTRYLQIELFVCFSQLILSILSIVLLQVFLHKSSSKFTDPPLILSIIALLLLLIFILRARSILKKLP